MQFKSITAITVLLLVVASLLVSGCTQTTTKTTSSPTATASQKSVATVTPTPRETVSAAAVTLPQQIGTYAHPKTGYKFVGYNVTINNIAAEISNSNPANWQLRDTAGNIYAPAIATYSDAINGLDNVNTQPGDKVSGIIVFEVRLKMLRLNH